MTGVASDEWRRVPSKKNTRRWCRGKPGVEHTLALRMSRWSYRTETCGPAPEWWQQIPRRSNIPWRCDHEEYCTGCGKILSPYLDYQRCPDYLSPSEDSRRA